MNRAADDDLLQAYLDGTLPGEQVPAVEERLAAEPELAERLLALALVEVGLREWAGRQAEVQPAPSVLPLPGPAPAPRLARSRRRWFVMGAAAAAVAAMVGFAFFAAPWTKEEAPLASLALVHGEVLVAGSSADAGAPGQKGAVLRPGQEVRTAEESLAVLQFFDGSKLELGPETVLRLESAGKARSPGKGVFLKSGVVEAEVAPQPRGKPLVLRTPQASIRAEGTRFFSAASSQSTRVELEEGQAEMTRTRDGQTILVGKGRYAFAAALEAKAAPPEPFLARPLPPRQTQPEAVIANQPGPVPALAFSPDGTTLAIAGWDGSVTLWDRLTRKVRRTWKAHPNNVRALTFAPDGSALMTGSADRVVRLWDPNSGEPSPVAFPRLKAEVNGGLYLPDGQTLMTLAGHRGIKGPEQLLLWDPRTGMEKGRLANQERPVLCVALSDDGRILAGGSKDGSVKLWAVEMRRELAALPVHLREVTALAFAPTDDPACGLLASAGRGEGIWLWDARTGEPRGILEGHTRNVNALAFLPGKGLLASAGGDGMVRIWDVRTGQEVRCFKGNNKGPVQSLAVDPAGRTLATGGSGKDRRVLLWKVEQP